MSMSIARTLAAWALFQEFVSRSQELLYPSLTSPYDGNYECLALARREDSRLKTIIEINLNGTGVFAGNADFRYNDNMTQDQIKRLAEDVATAAGLRLSNESTNLINKHYGTELADLRKMLRIFNSANKSDVLSKSEIVHRLKRASGVGGVGLPRDIDVSITDGVLRFCVSRVTQNMQEDCAAFEGWILVLKTWLNDVVRSVELDFTKPETPARQYGNPESGHYNRFLYRVHNMLRLFPEWFSLHESKRELIGDYMRWLRSKPCLLNHSHKQRIANYKVEGREHQIERWFASGKGRKLLCDRLAIAEDRLFFQLPVGVFHESIAKQNSVFSRGASAIDLWGVGKDSESLHIIELKSGGNRSIGVISELLLYTAVIYDTCIAEKPLISVGRYRTMKEDNADTLALQNAGVRFRRLGVHILTEQIHPLLSPAVEAALAEGLSILGIEFDCVRYDYSKEALLP